MVFDVVTLSGKKGAQLEGAPGQGPISRGAGGNSILPSFSWCHNCDLLRKQNWPGYPCMVKLLQHVLCGAALVKYPVITLNSFQKK